MVSVGEMKTPHLSILIAQALMSTCGAPAKAKPEAIKQLRNLVGAALTNARLPEVRIYQSADKFIIVAICSDCGQLFGMAGVDYKESGINRPFCQCTDWPSGRPEGTNSAPKDSTTGTT